MLILFYLMVYNNSYQFSFFIFTFFLLYCIMLRDLCSSSQIFLFFFLIELAIEALYCISHLIHYFLLFYNFLVFFFLFVFLGLHWQHMEVPRLGVELEL